MAKKKSSFDLNKYKTHDGERGDIDKWQEAARMAFLLENPEATKEEIEEKLTKLGKRRLQVD